MWPLFLALPLFHLGFLVEPAAGQWALLMMGGALAALTRRPMLDRLPLLALAPIAYALASTGWASSPLDAAGATVTWLTLALIATVAAGLTAAELRRCLLALALGIAVSGPLALAQWAGWQAPGVAVVVDPAGLFVNRNLLAEAALMAAAMLAASTWRWKLAAIAALVPALLLTGSANVFAGAALLGLVALWRAGWRWTAGLAGLAVLNAGLAWVNGMPASDLGVTARLGLWQDALAALTWSGHGAGAFPSAYPGLAAHATAATYGLTLQPGHVHNDAIELVFDFGLGALLFAAPVALALWKGARHEDDAGAWWGLAAVLGCGLGAFPLANPVTAAGAALCLGACLRSPRGAAQRRAAGGAAVHGRGGEPDLGLAAPGRPAFGGAQPAGAAHRAGLDDQSLRRAAAPEQRDHAGAPARAAADGGADQPAVWIALSALRPAAAVVAGGDAVAFERRGGGSPRAGAPHAGRARLPGNFRAAAHDRGA